MASFHEDSSKTMEEIRNDLICQICEGRPRPGKSQWYRCGNLHFICQNCKATKHKCACEKRISKVCCQIIEKLLNVKGLKFNCTNTKHGCQQAFLESALDDHESECIYRLLQCPVVAHDDNESIARACEESFAFKNAFDHYKQHDEDLIKCPNKFRRVEQTEKTLHFFFTKRANGIEIEYDGKIFVNECICLNGIVYYWVYFFGTPNEAKHYSTERKQPTFLKVKWSPLKNFFMTLSKLASAFQSLDKHSLPNSSTKIFNLNTRSKSRT